VLLCVDVGNTQIALGLYSDAAGSADEVDPPLVRDWRKRTDPRMNADEQDDSTEDGRVGKVCRSRCEQDHKKE